jgi:hypothetical protein
MQLLYDLSKVLFAEGWFFFVPYLLFYLVFKYFHLKIYYLENIFAFLHLFNTLLFIYYLCRFYPKKYLYKLVFWVCLILLFQIPGAYLEFPSDPWEHFRRIFEWQACTFVDDHSSSYKFTYFWGWTLMSKIEPLSRRTALDVYSTFWQFLLAYQFYLFALRIGFSEAWAKIQVLGTICLFGTNVFGFYRYYALSSTPLAYIAYLQSLIVIIDIFDGKRKKGFELILLLPIIYYNHYQELLLFLISTLGIFLAKLYEKKQAVLGKRIIYIIPVIILLSIIVGVLSIKFFQQYAVLISNFYNSYFQDYFKEKTPQYLTLDSNYWSKWGILRVWDQKLPYFQTLGFYGYFSMLFSLISWNKYRLLSTLTLLPLLLLFFQPFTLFIAIIDGHYTTFRILYAFPYSFMLVVAIKEMLKFINKTKKVYVNNYIVVAFLLFFLSVQPSLPWRGRLWHQLYKTPEQLSLKSLDVTAQWFFENRQLEYQYAIAQWFFENPTLASPCSILVTDNATSFSLATHFGLIPSNRLSSYNPSQSIKTVDSLNNYIDNSQNQQKICSFLVGIPARINPPAISEVGQNSGHWLPDIVRQDLNYSKEFVEVTTFLTSFGWSKTFVPPFYWLYEAPSSETLR